MTKSLRTALNAIALLIAALLALPAFASASVQVGSSSWQWGNPLPQGNSLHDLAFTPGSTTGYAVGDFGTVIKTTDAGATWTGLPAGTFTNLTRVQLAADGSIVVGGGCVMRLSSDGGVTFSRIAFSASEVTCAHQVVAFSFQSKTNGFILLDDGEVVGTTDGGQTVLSGTAGLPNTGGAATPGPAKPEDLTFLPDGLTGFGSTTDGAIYKTTDGAKTWTQVYNGNRPVQRIKFLDALNGYAVGAGGLFLHTSDGGATWVADASGTAENLTDVNCVNLTTCVASGDKGDLALITTDSGNTFKAPVPPVEVNAAAFASPTQIVTVGNAGATSVSADGGVTYTPVAGQKLAPTYNRLRAGGTDKTAYVVGPNGALASSTDGGQTWEPKKVQGAANVIDVSFPTPQVGWALDSSGALYTTINGGVSWKAIDTGSTAHADAVYASSASSVLVVGPHGIRHSTNTGVDFTSIPALNKLQLDSVDKAGPGVVLVYGEQDIQESTDNGKTFKAILKPGKYKKVGKKKVNRLGLISVDFVSAKVGFVLDDSGRLWNTKNGGTSWTELPATGTDEAASIAFSTATKGYLLIDTFGSITKDSGLLMRTNDGGQTWHPQFVISDPIQVNGLATSPSTDYLLSKNSNLLSTTTGGDRGKASTLKITPSSKSLTKPASIRVTGVLSPASGAEEVVVSMRAAGSLSWQHKIATADSNGKFTTTWSSLRKGANIFVAQWKGDFAADGTGTKVLTVNVGAKKKKTVKKHHK
jgi:photosystem II stability/assembly factor-like uncharacterized protein